MTRKAAFVSFINERQCLVRLARCHQRIRDDAYRLRIDGLFGSVVQRSDRIIFGVRYYGHVGVEDFRHLDIGL